VLQNMMGLFEPVLNLWCDAYCVRT